VSKSRATLDVAGTKVDVTNLDKILYPAVGFTKGQVIDYYVRISSVLLPYLKKRPITLKRYPNGVEGFFFYEKNCPARRPEWIKTANVSKKEGGEINYCVIDDLPALVWAANLADLELHTFLHVAPQMNRPQFVAFDLDPGPPADIVLCCKIGLWVRDIFAALGLESFAKTSGSKGLQVYVPLNTAASYETTKHFAHAIAEMLAKRAPNEVVSRMQKKLRSGKVLVDWSQNDARKTTINVYSLRAKDHPNVSTPVTWEEVESAWKRKKTLSFTSGETLERVERIGDIFAPVLKLKQKLPTLIALKKL
jgi:bifunctional non-homologous end joining protein LigD